MQTIESGYYRETAAGWIGPFQTRQHAWANAYANDELDIKKSVSKSTFMINKQGEFNRIYNSTDMVEGIADAANEGITKVYTILPVPVPVFCNLIGKDGLLNF